MSKKFVLKNQDSLYVFNSYDVALIAYKEKKMSIVLKNHTQIIAENLEYEDAEKIINEITKGGK